MASANLRVPDRAMVPRLLSMSSRLMPTPVSLPATVRADERQLQPMQVSVAQACALLRWMRRAFRHRGQSTNKRWMRRAFRHRGQSTNKQQEQD